MKKCYVFKQFSESSRKLISICNTIIEEYAAAGFVLTLRQLYYQCVARGYIPNEQKAYKRLGSIINDARLAGLVDWSALEDRTRNLVSPSTWNSPGSIVEACADQYQTDWWKDQPYYVEVYIEKDALLGVLEAACQPWQLPYFSCRGYTSASEVWQAARRIGRRTVAGQKVLILHLGDHDPSGCDMTRDIEERLRLFLKGDDRHPENLEVRRVALNMDQVREYDPPPNPAKLTDSRSTGYIAKHGNESWELDALSPEVLAGLIETNVVEVLDLKIWERQKEAQRLGQEELQVVSDFWQEVVDYAKEL